MKCKNCNVDINDTEIYCNDCKKIIENSNNSELEELIIENNKLNELEKTKVLDELSNLNSKDNNLSNIESNNSNIESSIIKIDSSKSRVEKNNLKRNNKRKLLIIIFSLIAVIVLCIIIILVLNNKKTNSSSVDKIDYELELSKYGKSLEESIKEYYSENNKIPSVSDLKISYDKYEVSCKVSEIYESLNVYLDNCSINNSPFKYSYGVKEEVEKKVISIYKNIDDTYTDKETESKVGNITCMKNDCLFIVGFNKYALVKEQDSYNLYDYTKDKMILELGSNYLSEDSLISYNGELYAVIYKQDGTDKLYSISSRKKFDVSGSLVTKDSYHNVYLLAKYGYVVFNENNTYNFINLNSGYTSYFIKEEIKEFKELNNFIYIITESDSKYKIYNHNGKSLFGNKYIDDFNINTNRIIISDSGIFKTYDTKINLLSTSRKYNKIFTLFDDYVLVLLKDKLELVDYKDNKIMEFDYEFTNDCKVVDSKIYKDGDNYMFKVEISNLGTSKKFFYNMTTKDLFEE